MERKTAFISGASRGIGEAIAITLSKEYNVIINYAHSEEGARAVLAQCDPEGHHKMIQCDISAGEQVKAMLEEIVKEYGHLDVVVNNAGITRDGLMMRMSEQDYDQVLDTNLKGAFLCCKAVCRPMMRQKFGRIINLSSVVGVRGNAGQANYAASKAGLIGLTKSLAKELAGKNITVNAVAPGFIETDMTHAMPEAARQATLASIPMGHTGSAEDVARAVAFFAAKENSYITGQVLCIDGGMAV